MKKNGFTLVELIAVITIMAIIAILAVPNTINLMDNSKKEQYVSDAKAMISRANYMYRLGTKTDKFVNTNQTHKIPIANLEKLEIDQDPFGCKYDKTNSYVIIEESTNSRTFSIYLRSVKTDDPNTVCYCIKKDNETLVNRDDLKAEFVKDQCS